MRRIYPVPILILCLVLVLSACTPSPETTQEEAAQAEEMLESVDETTSADLDPSTAGEEDEGVIGEDILEGEALDSSAFEGRELAFDFSDGCREVYPDTSLTVHQQTGTAGALATLFNEQFFTGVADAISMVNENGGPCGVELLLQAVSTDYDPTQMPDLQAQGMAETLPLFLFTYGQEAALALDEQVQTGDEASAVSDPDTTLLALEPQVVYLPGEREAEAMLSTEIRDVQLTIAEQTFAEAGYEEGAVSYLAGYSAVLAMVEIIQEILDQSGVEGLGEAVFFTAVSQEALPR
jgi:hypothetical protein